jgi:hypothetical protein
MGFKEKVRTTFSKGLYQRPDCMCVSKVTGPAVRASMNQYNIINPELIEKVNEDSEPVL